ncbi:hypothetical protein GALL_487650 [mine drainage metagenome]|uniref:Uncharacterized protein n=1 Tax=mine drainage metagenome TaxID=410659 RepID=A0A1J5PFS6_9ZZZZ
MLADDAGDVIVNHHHLIDQPHPLRREHPDGGRAAANPHPRLGLAVNNRRAPRLHHNGCAAVDSQLDRFAIAEPHHCIASHAPFGFGATGQVIDPAKRQHLAAVFRGDDQPHRLARRAHHRPLCTKMAVGVDLHFDTTVGIDRFGHHGHDINAVNRAADDEGRRFVIGISRARPDGRDEQVVITNQRPLPVGFQERPDLPSRGDTAVEHGQRVAPHDAAPLVGITVTGAGLAVGYVAHHRAGIAADLVGARARAAGHHAFAGIGAGVVAVIAHRRASRIAARSRCGKAGNCNNRAPLAWRIALRIAGAVGISTCSPNPFAPNGPSGSGTSIRIERISGMSPMVGIR